MKSKLMTLVLIIFGLSGIVALAAPFIFGNQVLYGSGISIQHFPLLASYHRQLHQGIFPFFDFDFSVGFDSLADSQQSLLHPVKLLIAFFAADSYAIDTLFILFHLFLLLIALGVYCNRLLTVVNNTRNQIASVSVFASFPLVLGLAIYTNLIHIYYVPVLAYGIWLLILLESAIENVRPWNFSGIALVTALMILCGNFTMQWTILGWLFTYSLVRIYKLKQSPRRVLPVLIAIAGGFLLAAPQLLPTFDLMLSSARATLGGAERFAMSPGPFQWFSYFVPGAIFFAYEHADNVYGFMVGNNVVDGVHYVGVIPLAAFFCAWRESRSNVRIAIFLVTLIFIAQRALGIFSPINIFLNYLPIFGQFRASVRYLFIVDITICFMAVLYLHSHFNRERFLAAIKFTLISATAIIGFIFIIASAYFYYRWKIIPTLGWFEVYYIFLPIISLMAARLVLKKNELDQKAVIAFLFLITLLDVSAHRYGTPTHWQAPTVAQLVEVTSSVDRLCQSKGANRVMLLRPERWDNTWFRFDLPIFPHRENDHFLYPIKATQPALEPNGYDCTLTHTMKSSTLTPKSTVELENWLNALTWSDRTPLLPYLGFQQVISYDYLKTTAQLTKNRRLEMTISEPGAPTPVQLKALSEFVESQPAQKKSVFQPLIRPVYGLIETLDLTKHLPSTIRKPHTLPGIGPVVVLQPPFSFMLFSNQKEIVPIGSKGSFVILPGVSLEPVEVKFIPVAFLVGLLISLGILLVGIFCILLWPRRLTEDLPEVGRYHRSISQMAGAISSGLRSMGANKKIFFPTIFIILTAVAGLMILMIFLGRFHITLQLFSMLALIILIYKVVYFVSDDEVFSRGLATVLCASHLGGLILMGIFNYLQSAKH